jgi:hypothetical protein
MTPERIAELRALCEAATRGPWRDYQGNIINPAGDAELGNWLVGSLRWADDRAFVTAAREALPAALDEIERLNVGSREGMV